MMQLLPPDYHKQVARELVEFFHTFYRFGGSTNVFNLEDPTYQQFLQNLFFGSLTIGAIVFVALCIIVIRRTILHIRSTNVRRWSMEMHAVEMTAVMLLSILAISSLSGLLGEAQVDYSVGLVREAMGNTSNVFSTTKHLATESFNTSGEVRLLAENLVVSFNESDLPAEAFKLSIEASRLLHASKDLVNVTSTLLPSHYPEMTKAWEFSYFMLKSTTNFAILSLALASFLSISSIGWSMVTPLRFSILVILSVVPISHTLIGVYLSSTIVTADFCAAPMNSTMTLLNSTAAVNYYLECPTNTANPFAAYAASMDESRATVASLQQVVETYAAHHGDIGLRMKNDFLDPMGIQIQHLDSYLTSFNETQLCHNVSAGIVRATTAYCEYGMLGFFSMWVHQILLCLLLFVSIVTSVLVYERVHIREIHNDMRYQLLSTYEDDEGEHVYLSSD